MKTPTTIKLKVYRKSLVYIQTQWVWLIQRLVHADILHTYQPTCINEVAWHWKNTFLLIILFLFFYWQPIKKISYRFRFSKSLTLQGVGKSQRTIDIEFNNTSPIAAWRIETGECLPHLRENTDKRVSCIGYLLYTTLPYSYWKYTGLQNVSTKNVVELYLKSPTISSSILGQFFLAFTISVSYCNVKAVKDFVKHS